MRHVIIRQSFGTIVTDNAAFRQVLFDDKFMPPIGLLLHIKPQLIQPRFIGDAVDYVLNQLIETMLVKDRDFVAWRQEHPHEVVVPSARRPFKTTAAGNGERQR